jgi:hypothetical protein
LDLTDSNNTGNPQIFIRARKGSASGKTVKMSYQLMEGSTVIRGPVLSGAMDDFYQDFGVTLTDTNLANIGDPSNLDLRIEADFSGTGDPRELWVTVARLDTPAPTDIVSKEYAPSTDCNGAASPTDNIHDVSGGGSALSDAMANNNTNDGDVFCVADGAYTTPNSGLDIDNGDVLNGDDYADPENGVQPGAVVTAPREDAQSVIDGSSVDDVEIYDMKFVGGDDQPDSEVTELEPQDHDCTTDGDANDCGTTIEPDDNWLIARSVIQGVAAQGDTCGEDAGTDGIASGTTRGIGSAGTGLVLYDVEIYDVGQHYECYKASGTISNGSIANNGVAAAVKTGQAGAYEAFHVYIHDNDQGLWCDTGCDDSNYSGLGFIVVQSLLEDNAQFGIHYENTYYTGSPCPCTGQSARILNNVIRGNAWNDSPGVSDHDADLAFVESIDGVAVNNDFGSSAARGINWDDSEWADSDSDPDATARRGFEGQDDGANQATGLFPVSNNRFTVGEGSNTVETRDCDAGFDTCISFGADQ